MTMSLSDIQRELGKLEELRAALIGQATHATSADKIRALEAAQPHIKPKTKAMAALLEFGYRMNVEQAEAILKERKANPQSWPYEKYEAAQAFMAAYAAKPTVTSKRAGWRRTRG